MSRSQETSQRLTGGEREQPPCQSPIEYIHSATGTEEQLEHSQEIIDAADKMLARGEDGSILGRVDTTYLDTNDKQHLGFMLEYRGRGEDSELPADGQTLEQAIDEAIAGNESYDRFIGATTTSQNVTAKRVLRCKVAAEVIKARLETEQREEPSADDTLEHG